jgi:hypothetical protein
MQHQGLKNNVIAAIFIPFCHVDMKTTIILYSQ